MIDLLGALGTIIAIIASVYIAKSSLENVLVQQKAENSLKRIDELPKLLNDFIDSTKSLVICAYVTHDKDKQKEASKNFDSTLPQLQRILLSELESLKEYAANGELDFKDEQVYSGFNQFWDAFMRHEYDNN